MRQASHLRKPSIPDSSGSHHGLQERERTGLLPGAVSVWRSRIRKSAAVISACSIRASGLGNTACGMERSGELRIGKDFTLQFPALALVDDNGLRRVTIGPVFADHIAIAVEGGDDFGHSSGCCLVVEANQRSQYQYGSGYDFPECPCGHERACRDEDCDEQEKRRNAQCTCFESEKIVHCCPRMVEEVWSR